MLVKICMAVQNMACHSHQCCHFWKASLIISPSLHPVYMFGLHKHPATMMNVNGCYFFLCGRIQWHTFPSHALRFQVPFSQTAPLLLSVAWQQNLAECRCEGSTPTATPPTSTSDATGQRHKQGGTTFGAALGSFYLRAYFYGKFSLLTFS